MFIFTQLSKSFFFQLFLKKGVGVYVNFRYYRSARFIEGTAIFSIYMQNFETCTRQPVPSVELMFSMHEL